MDQREEDGVDLSDGQQEVDQKPTDQSVLPTRNSDQKDNSVDEWDTDLETDNATGQRQSSSRAELYLQLCRKTGTNPVSCFLGDLSEANINLNHYGLGPLGAKALAIALQNLSNNQLRLEGADIVSRLLANSCYLTSMKLSGNDFDDSASKHLADALRDDFVLKEVDLSHNKFGDAAGEHLGQMIASNLGIEVLNLSWNRLCGRGGVALSTGLKVNSTLKQLQLAWNGFGHMEAESLGQALKQNNTLELLDLSGNHINDQAVMLFCQGLASNSTLRVLKLSYNTVTNVGALRLLKTVKNNKRSAVEEINISTVFVREEFVELLEEARQRRPALDVQYSVMSSVTRNLAAIQIFQKYFEERSESVMDFFQALDKEGTMKVSTSDFRKAVKAANIPLDRRQLEWLIKKFDKNCTATIRYSHFAELS
uniref:leucine-rich repeat-containing protein 74A-like isoform X4 n=1 Tax=Scatophagus argus TaxID=75038 RepID=UPI001ED8277F|nr:leucine-rich repeat-containing protein 74A-like isoform X4 [Scatophagus argus]